MTLVERCARIDVLVLDVDGVLTDGRIVYTDAGEEIKAFHVRDGSGLKLWEAEGKKAGIITGRRSPIVERRAKELGITHVTQGAVDKGAALAMMLKELGVAPERVAAIEIGRASCRERVESSVVDGSVKKQERND